MKIKTEINDIILKILPSNSEAYIVGGYIRDKKLGLCTYDTDYVLTNTDILGFAKKFANQIEGHFVPLDEENEIARVVLSDKINHVDFAKCIGKDIYEDIERRDFTINAIAYDIRKKELIDTYKGEKDIESGIIRVFKEQNLIDDPLRVLRAYRFASKLGFNIEENSRQMLEKHYKLLSEKNVAKERIQTEFLKLLMGEKSADILQEIKETGLLYEVFTELSLQKDIPPNLHHHLGLIDHSIETVRQIELFIKQEPKWIQEHLNQDFISGISRLAFLKLGALLHDLGKPETWTIENDDKGIERHRFIKHDEVGAQLTKSMLKRLKYSKNQISYISKLVKNHIYPSHLLRSGVSEKALLRMFRKLENETVDILLLAKADRLSAQGEEITAKDVEENIHGINDLLNKYNQSKELLKPLPKLLSGDEIAQILNIKPGAELGKIIKKLKDAQICNEVISKEDAIEFIKKLK